MSRFTNQRVPVDIVRRVSRSCSLESRVRLDARQVGGLLLHPVPIPEMRRTWGVETRGSKIVADWSPDLDAGTVRAGDLLEIRGRSYLLAGLHVQPGEAIELFVRDE